jgi:hypothetical protein
VKLYLVQIRQAGISASLHAQSQTALIDFLSTDTGVAATLLDTAKITHDSERKSAILEAVRQAVVSIRRLAGGIQDPDKRAEIEDGANKLEDSLVLFQN